MIFLDSCEASKQPKNPMSLEDTFELQNIIKKTKRSDGKLNYHLSRTKKIDIKD